MVNVFKILWRWATCCIFCVLTTKYKIQILIIVLATCKWLLALCCLINLIWFDNTSSCGALPLLGLCSVKSQCHVTRSTKYVYVTDGQTDRIAVAKTALSIAARCNCRFCRPTLCSISTLMNNKPKKNNSKTWPILIKFGVYMYRVSQKPDCFLKVWNSRICWHKIAFYTKLFSILSGVRLVYCMSLYLNILCAISV